MRWWHCLGLVLGLGLIGTSVPVVARAQADAAQEQAKVFFEAGKKAFEAGDFPGALAHFEKANSIKPHPVMFKFIGKTHEAMGNVPKAVDFYSRYLESNPKDADKITEALNALKKALAASFATVELTTEPTGAHVWLGAKAGPPRGTTPVTLQVPAGKQILVIEKPGYQLLQRPIMLAAGRVTPVGIALPPLMPVLVVRSTPVGAQVVIDGKVVGKTPFNQAVRGGAHKLEVRLSGHATTARDIELTAAHTAGAPFVVDATLAEAAAPGLLSLDVDRKGSIVRVDGSDVGTVPLGQPIFLPEGLHKLEVVPPGGGKAHEEMVTIQAGQTTVTRVNLGGSVEPASDGKGISGRTWSYIIMGTGAAVLATGGVFGILASSANGDLEDCRSSTSCKRTQAEVDKADAVRSKALLTDIFLGTGIAAAGAGLAVFFLSDAPPDAAPGVSIVPTLGGAAAIGRFDF